jgi:6,7-dimethyl-8-ribityllumazine synthase
MKQAHSTRSLPSIPGAKIAILSTKWYRSEVDRMVGKCMETLALTGCDEPDLHVLPGCVELPLAARRVLRSGKRRSAKGYEALITFGIVLKGETYHFEMIVDDCMRGLSRVMFEEDTPIIVEVLPVLSLEQAIARSGDDECNKGIEAAAAAAEIIHWRRSNPLG